MTTRKMREGEVEGVDYYFRSREEFEQMIAKGEMLNMQNMSGIIMVHHYRMSTKPRRRKRRFS